MRSRLVRLIPERDPETTATKYFFNHRLPRSYSEARAEWHELLDGTHPLWTDISSPKRELIRSHLNAFNLEVVKRMRPSSRFDFSGSSIGNLFLTGARLFTGSFEAAIYLLSSICSVPDRIAVLPAVNTNFALHIAAGLVDGTVITGQNDISHPSAPTAAVPIASNPGITLHYGGGSEVQQLGQDVEEHDKVEDANLPGSLPALRRPAIDFSKDDEEDLPSRIDRLWYINPYGQEIRIPANPRVLDAIWHSNSVIYSIGSLFTSLVPNLVLKGVGDALSNPLIRNKILILNGTIDRETGPSSNPLTAIDFVATIANACADSQGRPPSSAPPPGEATSSVLRRRRVVEEDEYCHYVTHVVYLEGPSAPKVDRQRFTTIGIDVTRVYGPRDGDGRGGRYDAKGLAQALEGIVGRKGIKQDRTRRNTLEK